MDASADDARVEKILRATTKLLPARVLEEILGLNRSALARLRKSLSVNPTAAQSRAVTKNFLAKLPDISELGLSFEQRRQVALLRETWLRGKVDGEAQADCEQNVAKYSDKLPTSALAAIVELTPEMVIKYQQKLGLEINRPTRRRLEHEFCSARRCPQFSDLSKAERARLATTWKSANAKYQQARTTRQSNSSNYAEQLLAELKRKKDEYHSNNQTVDEVKDVPCTGRCRQSWPPSSEFFGPNFRSPNGLSNRCNYCLFLTRNTNKRSGKKRTNRPKGRKLSDSETRLILDIIRKHYRKIPSILFRHLFRIGDGTLVRLRREAGIEMSMSKSREIFWRWYFSNETPDLPELNDTQLAQLHLLSRTLRDKTNQKFDRDHSYRKMLLSEAIELRRGMTAEQIEAEPECRQCKDRYPATDQFFRENKGYLDRICKVCLVYNQAQKRRAKLAQKHTRNL